MVAAITPRQWDGLVAATGLAAEFEQLSQKLGLNLGLEGDRFKARAGITEFKSLVCRSPRG